jgi:hypothetical protein
MATTGTPIVFDPFNPDFLANPYPLLHHLREHDPVHRSPLGFWVLTRYDDVAHVMRNAQLFGAFMQPDRLRTQLGDGAAFAYVSRRLGSYDPPDHTRLRSLVTKAFTVRRVEAMRPHIQALTDTLLEAIRETPPVDIIAALAHPLPSLVICEMLGVPEADRAQLSAWTMEIAFLIALAIPPDRLRIAEQAANDFRGYVRALITKRRHTLGHDLLSALITAETAGDRLTEEELVATIMFLFSAGHQTTRDLVGNGLLALLRHPEQWQQLVANPALVPAAVEESLRYDPPTTGPRRRALVDTTINGVAIAAGDQLFPSICAANRDPARFVDPDRFDLHRADKEHVTFGGGIHYCVGAALARVEAQIIFGTLSRRFPALELADEHIQWRESMSFRGPVALHVAW